MEINIALSQHLAENKSISRRNDDGEEIEEGELMTVSEVSDVDARRTAEARTCKMRR